MKKIFTASILYFVLTPIVPVTAQTVAPRLFQIVQNGRYGYIDNSGKVVVQPQFVWASEFKEGLADAYVCGRMISIDETGNLLPRVQKAPLQARKVGDKFGFVDRSGQIRIPAQFDEARWFSEGLAAVRIGNKWGYIDEAGVKAIAFQYADAMEFKDGKAKVAFGELRRADSIKEISLNKDGEGIIDRTGRVIVKGLDQIGGFSEDRIAAEKNNRWGYLGVNGAIVIPFVYEDASAFADGLAAVQKGGKWGYIDKKGQIIVPFIYDEADTFSEQLAVVKKDGKSGYVDLEGAVVIPLQFDEAGRFQAGLAAVSREEESGFIEKSGNFAFKIAFDYASGFTDSHDLSRFWKQDGRFGYVDHSGRVLWESAAPETIEPFQFPQWFEENREASCVGIVDDIKNKVATFSSEP